MAMDVVGHSIMLIMLFLRVFCFRVQWPSDMPNLIIANLTSIAFESAEVFTINGGIPLSTISWRDIGALAYHANIPKRIPRATVSTIDDFLSLDTNVTEIVFNNACLNDRSITSLDLSRFKSVRRIEFGSYNFYYASLELKSVQEENEWWLDMPNLKSLIFGYKAFWMCDRVVFESVYCLCERWLDLPALCTIQSDNAFASTPSLELKSVLIHREWWLDMPSLKTIVFGWWAFGGCTRVVFESDWLWCEWLNRLA